MRQGLILVCSYLLFSRSQSTALKFNILSSFILLSRLFLVSALPVGKEGAAPGFRYFFICVGAMFTAIATAVAPFKEEMFSEHHIAVFIVIEINPLLQRLRHRMVIL